MLFRFYTKRRLHKSMETRDRARSDLYDAQLRLASAPATPGFPAPPASARDGAYNPLYSPRFAVPLTGGIPPAYTSVGATASPADVKLPAVTQIQTQTQTQTQYATAIPMTLSTARPFALQAAPATRTTPKPAQRGFDGADEADASPTVGEGGGLPASPGEAARQAQAPHQPAAPGEVVYEAIGIPGAYASPLGSPRVG